MTESNNVVNFNLYEKELNMFKNETLKESTFKKGMAIFYTLGSAIGSYFTWPWGLIFFGTTSGAIIAWSLFSNDTKFISDGSTQTEDENQHYEQINNGEIEGQPGLQLINYPQTPTAPAITYQFSLDSSNKDLEIANDAPSNKVTILNF